VVRRYCCVESYATSRGGARPRGRRSAGLSRQDSKIASLLRHDVQQSIADRGATGTIATPNFGMIRDERAAPLIVRFVMESLAAGCSTTKVSACRSSVIEIIGISRTKTKSRATNCGGKCLRSLGASQIVATKLPAAIKNQTMFSSASMRSLCGDVYARLLRDYTCQN
jgi:hypothetical protein